MSDYFLVRLCIGVKGVTLFNKCRDRWTRRMIRMICGRQDGYTVRQRWENESDGLAVGQ